MCLNPKWIYKKGFYKEDNYRGKKGEFYELGTYSKCGCCEQCINEKSNNWAIRNHYESMGTKRKAFITLTYENNPYILVRKDFQDFMKRLRINLDRSTGEKIRFFEAGEYGTLRGRPHGHIIIYGWDDPSMKYKGINESGNLYYTSELIQDTWGLGRTSIQEFVDEEIPYTALYTTPKETFSKAYKLTRPKIHQIEGLLKNNRMPRNQRLNLYEELDKAYREMENEKKEYYLVKEFNSWSIALGWEEFKKQYDKAEKKCFEEYFGDKIFVTPTPWVKKLANMGDKYAAEEMFKREKMIKQAATEEEERINNLNKVNMRKKEAIIKWGDEKTKITINL